MLSIGWPQLLPATLLKCRPASYCGRIHAANRERHGILMQMAGQMWGVVGRVCEGASAQPGRLAMAWLTRVWFKWCNCSCLTTWPNRIELYLDRVCVACTYKYGDPRFRMW